MRETKHFVGFLTTIRCRPGKRQSSRYRGTYCFGDYVNPVAATVNFRVIIWTRRGPCGSTSRRNQPASNPGRAWRHVREMTWKKNNDKKDRDGCSLVPVWWAEGTRNNGAFGRRDSLRQRKVCVFINMPAELQR